uniref:NBS-LRR disease resistance protein homologue n=1 Tax=Hordeum vulgare TaxID=4513 RepID=Q84KC8_HORVU|nr:NBS-LRR disease resistance protein homologue [Hordeum vulgare]
MDFAVDAALWVVGKALAPVTGGLLESWAASTELGRNIDALKMQLLYAQGMLDNAQGRDIRSPALKELLHKLRELAYGADDALDELDYFRIQDELDGTYHAADLDAQNCVDRLAINARHTAKAAGIKLKCSSSSTRADPDDQKDGGTRVCLSVVGSCGGHDISSSPPLRTTQGVQEADGGCMPNVVSCARSAAKTMGKHFPCHSFPSVHDDDADAVMLKSSNMTGSGRRFLCSAWPSKVLQENNTMQTQKLKFDRVVMSTKILEIIEQLKPLCAMVSTILILELLGSTHIPTAQDITNRPKTTPNIIEPALYGRNDLKKNIIDGITHGKYCTNELTVVPLVGPGGIGKTTLTQNIFRELEGSFQVSVWVCVSLDFNAERLTQEIVKKIPKVNDEKDNATNHEVIAQRLKSKRLLLVLHDVWTYHEDEWKKLLAPLNQTGGEKGNVVIVTTRIPKVASMVTTTNSSIDVERLTHEDTMSFFEVCVFGDQQPWKDHPELRDVGSKIVKKLKGFPLAAKTVGRLLRNHLTLDHWTRVAESKEWELHTNDNDIMPALKLSYNYLPFHLQQCFSYCGLFPEDYEFTSKELVHFWIGLGIIRSLDRARRTEDVALCYLNDLVNHGFFRKNEKENGPHYVIHDLLHNLAVMVSSYECLSIYSSNMQTIQIPASVRHLSIIVDNTDVKDITTFREYNSYLSALGKRLKVQNLRTLILFGAYHGSFAKTFRGLFEEARALRTIFFSGASYSVDDVLLNFSKLVHLRYLRITSVHNKDMCLPSALFRSYHLEVIDLENWGGSFGSTSQMSSLIKLRHFVVPQYNLELFSSIFEVGKIKLLEELRRFEVRKETKGFELSQLGELTELGGSLGIYNLENVQKKDEADELKLMNKNHLHKLTLEWSFDRPIRDAEQEKNVIESLVPHSSLQDLCIRGHGGGICPSWLGRYLSVQNLESLSLCNVSWNTLPPLGELRFIDDPDEECKGLVSSQSFLILKRLELVEIPRLAKWVGNGKCHLFSVLEVVIIQDCPELVELPFSHPSCHQAKQEDNMIWFPKLRELKIIHCPKLASLPAIPWTEDPCSVQIEQAGLVFEKLVYSRNYESELSLEIEGKDGQHSVFWNVLAFHNLADLKVLKVKNCPPLPLIHLQKLKSLKSLTITGMSNSLLLFECESYNTECPLPVEQIKIDECDANGKELTQLLTHFPKITKLVVSSCEKITEIGAVELQTEMATASSPGNEIDIEHAQAEAGHHQTRGEEVEEAVAGGEGLLLLPRQLEKLIISGCRELRLLSDSIGKDNTHGGGLQSLCSIRSLDIYDCPRILSSYSSSTLSCFPFPASLQQLDLGDVEGMETLAPLSNLISLTSLTMCNCGDLRGEGLWPLVAQGRLTELLIFGTRKFFTGSEPSRLHGQEIPSSKLERVFTDDLTGVLTAPICRLLSSSLTELTFCENQEVERFTEEHEEALHLLNSLQELFFRDCGKLQRLPAGLARLASLKILRIWWCPAIRSLPKDGLPSSLQELDIKVCPAIKSLPKDGLPSSLQELEIRNCPAIKSLPKDGLPSSLRKLEVCDGISEELKRQCRKLKGTIPIIIDY